MININRIYHVNTSYDFFAVCTVDAQRCNQTNLSARTGLAFSVLLMGHPLVEPTPKRFCFPGSNLCLQTVVEGAVLCGVEVLASAEDVKGLKGSFAGRGLDEVLKQLPYIVPLLLCLSHLPSCSRWSGVRRRLLSSAVSARCGYTLSLARTIMPRLRRQDT